MKFLSISIWLVFLTNSILFAQDLVNDCFSGYLEQGNHALATSDFEVAIKSFDGATKCPEITNVQRDSARLLEQKAYAAYAEALKTQRDSAELAAENERKARNLANIARQEAELAYKESEANRIALIAQELLENGDTENALELAYFALRSHRALKIELAAILNTFYQAVKDSKLFYENTQQSIYSVEIGANDSIPLLNVLTADRISLYSFTGEQIGDIPNQSSIKQTKYLAQTDFLGIDGQSPGIFKLSENKGLNESLQIIGGLSAANKFLEISVQGNDFFVGDNEGSIHHISFNKNQMTATTITSFASPISNMASANQHTYLLAGDISGAIQLYDAEQGISKTLEKHQGMIQKLEWSSSDEYACSVGLDSTINVWNAQGELVNSLHLDHPVENVRFIHHREESIILSSNGRIEEWNFIYNRIEPARFLQNSNIESFEITPNGKLLFYWSKAQLTIWNTITEEFFEIEYGEPIVSLKVSPDEQYFLVGHLNGNAKLYNLQGQVVLEFNQFAGPVYQVAFSQDGKFVIAFQRNGNLVVCPNPDFVYAELEARNFELSKELKMEYNIK